MQPVLLAAVHNGELATAPARAVIDALSADGLVTRTVEVVAQPPLTDDPDRSVLVDWRGRQRELEHEWRAYLGTAGVLRDIAATAGEVQFQVRVHADTSFAKKAWLARQVETFVTAKHIAAWRIFVESGADELLVVESDATMQADSAPAIRTLLDSSPGADGLRYVNLAGGLAQDDIAIAHLVASHVPGAIVFAKPVTNTSCAYLVNRPFVDAMLAFVDRTPTATSLGIDWLFNAFFLDSDRRGRAIACIHADPPALLHGSIAGVTTSWHPDR